jgi:hypothetical protein
MKPKLHRIFFELLIGGPNQSHKVNFKEPPSLAKGRSIKTYCRSSVKNFSKLFFEFFFQVFRLKIFKELPSWEAFLRHRPQKGVRTMLSSDPTTSSFFEKVF